VHVTDCQPKIILCPLKSWLRLCHDRPEEASQIWGERIDVPNIVSWHRLANLLGFRLNADPERRRSNQNLTHTMTALMQGRDAGLANGYLSISQYGFEPMLNTWKGLLWRFEQPSSVWHK
jgi:hypothetical protein